MPKHNCKNGKRFGGNFSPKTLQRELDARQKFGDRALHLAQTYADDSSPGAEDNTARPVRQHTPRSKLAQQMGSAALDSHAG